MRKRIILTIVIFIVVTGGVMSCKQNYPPGGPHFYSGWKSYIVPFQPTGEITYEQARNLDSYYEAFFDEKGKIGKFTKYLKGQIEFVAIYNYRPDGSLEKSEITKSNGDKTEQLFNEKGQLVKK